VTFVADKVALGKGFLQLFCFSIVIVTGTEIAVGIASHYGLDGKGIESPWG
jgi:hypothetical protein